MGEEKWEKTEEQSNSFCLILSSLPGNGWWRKETSQTHFSFSFHLKSYNQAYENLGEKEPLTFLLLTFPLQYVCCPYSISTTETNKIVI